VRKFLTYQIDLKFLSEIPGLKLTKIDKKDPDFSRSFLWCGAGFLSDSRFHRAGYLAVWEPPT